MFHYAEIELKRSSMIDAAEAAEIRRAEWDVSEFLGKIRIFVGDTSAHEALYDGLRGKISDLLRSGAEGTEVEEWRDLLDQAIALASSRMEQSPDGYATLALRLNVLRDLNADILEQLSTYAVPDLYKFPHLQSCLEAIQNSNGEIARGLLISILGLKEANGTRVIKLLENVRLIRRRRSGRRVTVSITPEGREVLRGWKREQNKGYVSDKVIPLLRAFPPMTDTKEFSAAVEGGC